MTRGLADEIPSRTGRQPHFRRAIKYCSSTSTRGVLLSYLFHVTRIQCARAVERIVSSLCSVALIRSPNIARAATGPRQQQQRAERHECFFPGDRLSGMGDRADHGAGVSDFGKALAPLPAFRPVPAPRLFSWHCLCVSLLLPSISRELFAQCLRISRVPYRLSSLLTEVFSLRVPMRKRLPGACVRFASRKLCSVVKPIDPTFATTEAQRDRNWSLVRTVGGRLRAAARWPSSSSTTHTYNLRRRCRHHRHCLLK